MFKGSAHVPAEEHSRIIEAVGGFDNAETTDDTTNFFETFPSNYLERVLWLEADRMGSLNVSEENFKSEREVVKEERRVRVENQPYGYLEEDLRAAAFTEHAYHHTAIGSMADLDNAKIEDVRQFFNTFYKPNNATLVIVGDFNSRQALLWTKKYFDGIPASAKPIPRINHPEPPQTAERIVKKSYSNTPLPAIVIGYKIPPRYHARHLSARPRFQYSFGRRKQPALPDARLQSIKLRCRPLVRRISPRIRICLGLRDHESGPHRRKMGRNRWSLCSTV